MYTGFVTKIKNVRKHSNADRLQVGDCFGNNVIIGMDAQDGELGVYFPSDGKLGKEYAEENNLVRKKDENGNNVGGYLDPEKRNIRALKLRGEISDGLFMPLESLSKFTDIYKLKEGEQITVLDGVLICEKYVPRRNRRGGNNDGSKANKKVSRIKYPNFTEHINTKQLAYYKNNFKDGDLCYITLKMHGTSGRTSHTLKEEESKLPNIIKKIFKVKPKMSYDYVSGTRRVVLSNFNDSGYYGTNEFRKKWHDLFAGKLHKGESIYYEIVGWIDEDRTVMPICSNKKLNDKSFLKRYGDDTVFSYGCDVGEGNIFVYRMTMTNEDGYTVEYPTELIKTRCEQIGVNMVPILDKFLFTSIEDLEERVNNHLDGEDPIGKTHIREGVIVRIENRERFVALKHKSFEFKVLEGIIKDSGVLDIEEAEEK